MKRVLFALLLIAILATPAWADYPILLFGGEIDSIYIGAPQTVTPIEGPELVVNGDMETGNPPTGWSAYNLATLAGVPDERTGGSGIQSISITNSVAARSGARQNVSATIGDFLILSLWLKNISSGSGYFAYLYGASAFLTLTDNTANWNNLSGIAQTPVSTVSIRAQNGGLVIGEEIRADDISVKAFSWTSLVGDVRTAASSGTFTTAWPTAPTNGHRVGLIICLDSASNPQNFIMASLDGTNAYLAKWVGGTYTNLISSASAFAAGNLLQIVKDGNSVQLWHKGSQILTTQTVSDAGVTGNTKFCWFTTNGSLKPTYVQWVR